MKWYTIIGGLVKEFGVTSQSLPVGFTTVTLRAL